MAKPVKHGSGWRARWIDEHGHRESATFSTYEDANVFLIKSEAEVAEIKHGWATGKPIDRSMDQLFDLWLDTQLSAKKSPKDIRSIVDKHLRPFFGKMQIRRVSPVEIDRYVAAKRRQKGARRSSTLSPKTIRNHLTLLQTMLGYAADCRWIDRAPRVRKPRVVGDQYRYLRTDEQIDRFLAAAKKEGDDLYMLYKTAIYTGLRAGELAGLRWSDVDFGPRNPHITVRRSFSSSTKNGKVRHVPLYDVISLELQIWHQTRLSRHPALVFPSPRGSMLGPSAREFQEKLHVVLERAGFEDADPVNDHRKRFITFHDLRHTFASHFVMNGGDVFHLMEIMGHSSVDVTRKYAHLAPGSLESDLGRFGSGPAVGRRVVSFPGATPARTAARDSA